MRKAKLILSCEHGGNKLPSPWDKQVAIPKKVLASHRGWDIGALELTLALQRAGASQVFIHEVSRLLIELNRSLHHPKLFSEFCEKLSQDERKLLIQNIHLPYRSKVAMAIQSHYSKGKDVWHVSVHSFTPVLEGVERQAEIGILYDPAREGEKQFAKAWRDLLKNKLGDRYRIRMNYPYRGTADGFVTALRKTFHSDRYVGIELEVNQGLYRDPIRWNEMSKALQQTLLTLVNKGMVSWTS
ncbi:MAG: N-formylglutamate amidohydrolase [Chlamydiales bacterium]|nr:N-formylglutamate amidohydrolase [Chlamydiales bacterium]